LCGDDERGKQWSEVGRQDDKRGPNVDFASALVLVEVVLSTVYYKTLTHVRERSTCLVKVSDNKVRVEAASAEAVTNL
jgi:hypothetical protein